MTLPMYRAMLDSLVAVLEVAMGDDWSTMYKAAWDAQIEELMSRVARIYEEEALDSI